jgi:hypothetical protein
MQESSIDRFVVPVPQSQDVMTEIVSLPGFFVSETCVLSSRTGCHARVSFPSNGSVHLDVSPSPAKAAQPAGATHAKTAALVRIV